MASNANVMAVMLLLPNVRANADMSIISNVPRMMIESHKCPSTSAPTRCQSSLKEFSAVNGASRVGAY